MLLAESSSGYGGGLLARKQTSVKASMSELDCM
jgi:hypothetical protein